MKKIIISSIVAAMAVTSLAAKDCTLSLTTSAYVNWNLINAAKDIGMLDKAEKKNKCDLKITYMADYLQSINAYVAGQQEAVTVTNLDQMTAIAPYPSNTIVIQDYSNGNDGLISRSGNSMNDLVGQEVWMVTKSISELLFVKAAERAGKDAYKDYKIMHMDMDSNLRAGYDAGNIDNIVTWNPALNYLVDQTNSGSTIVDSASFGGLIVDQIVLNPTVDDYEKKAQLLRDSWDKIASVINKGYGREYMNLVKAVAEDMESTEANAKAMLGGSKIFTPEQEMDFYTTKMFKLQKDVYDTARANEFFVSQDPIQYNLNGSYGGEKSGGVSVLFDIK